MLYKGKNQKLAAEIVAHQEKLERVYERFLGRDLYRKLVSMEKQILVPEAFADSLEEFDKGISVNRASVGTPEDNKFRVRVSYMADISLEDNGRIICKPNSVLNTSSGIIITEKGVEIYSSVHPNTPSYLAPYIHEYSHFATYALQESPVVCSFLLAAIESQKEGIRVNISDFQSIINLKNEFAESKDSKKLGLLYLQSHLFDISEAQANEIQNRVLNGIGYRTDKFKEFYLRRNQVARDLNQMSEERLVDYILNWEKIETGTDFTNNFLDSLKNLRFRKIDINTFHHQQKRQQPED
ncbi:MAG: hypothetical protein HYX24_03850 [Candidatus Aenigmarchaeota archaeon]|nr:hypothetical protein [Candidatus Aenigmarchaeota archaeon]